MKTPPRLFHVVRNGYGLRAQCPACGHRAELSVRRIVKWYGERADLEAVKRRLRCTRCRRRGCDLQVSVGWGN